MLKQNTGMVDGCFIWRIFANALSWSLLKHRRCQDEVINPNDSARNHPSEEK
jgi:hypothetical protein